MPLKTELDARAMKMQSILGDVNSALEERGSESVANFSGIANAIKAVGGGVANGVTYEEVNEAGEIVRGTAHGLPVVCYAFAYQREMTTVNLPEGLTVINIGTFTNCSKMNTVNLSDDITDIGQQAFYGCTALSISKLPASVVNIDSSAFYNCRALAITEIPAGVKNLGSLAFSNCTTLKSLTFKGTPDTIAKNVFNNCTNLTVIKVPWAEGAVANAPWGATKATITYNYTGA